MLLTGGPVKIEKATRLLPYEQYTKNFFKSWLRFAQEQGFQADLKNLILVTGHETTRHWAMAAFANNRTKLRITFQAGLAGSPYVNTSLWGSWASSHNIYAHVGPVDPETEHTMLSASSVRGILEPAHQSPTGSGDDECSQDTRRDTDEPMQNVESSSDNIQPAEREISRDASSASSPQIVGDIDQCIFIQGFRMRARPFLAPQVIRAGAEPPKDHSFGGDDEPSASATWRGTCNILLQL